ncbi:AraC family transcriptional regulator [Vibrio aquaticus]|uniref:AraC family transcriptional regulator n=1 Tax=Vibrio aquaticus TaxID=2496559 RepID=A0A3S0Q3C9_9VIBR|nr:AraC family transcriptional regulator [Vibrio aquaticus]RTZ17611.1 AraC family transcriptional regulator [Vibrio aquaticus]
MHYAISFQTEQHDFLLCTPRRKSLKHKLLCVKQGLVIVKLGKQEYAIEPNQLFWLPFDTLTSLTYTPNTQVEVVELSSRVTTPLPKQAGFVKANELVSALLNRLTSIETLTEQQKELLAVLRHELIDLKPNLHESKLTKDLSQWRFDKPSPIANELQLVLRVREAVKMMQSGKKRPIVVNTLFEGNETLFSGLEKAIIGH